MPITQERMVAVLTEAEALFHQHEDLRVDLKQRIAAQYQYPQPIKDFLSDLILAIEQSKAEAGRAMLIERYHFDRVWKRNEKMKHLQLERRRSRGIEAPKHPQRRPQLGEHLYPSTGVDRVAAALAKARELAADSDPKAMQPEDLSGGFGAKASPEVEAEIEDELSPEELEAEYQRLMGGKPDVPERV